MKRGIGALVTAMLVAVTAPVALGSAWAGPAASPAASSPYPTKPIDLIAPAPPGRGWDLIARAAARVLNEEHLIPVPIVVNNMPGGNGAVALSHMITRRKGDPYMMTVMGSALTGMLARRVVPYTFRDTTPVAAVAGDYYLIAVRRDSAFNTLRTLREVLGRDPGLITFGGSLPSGSLPHLAVALLARQQGIDASRIRYVSFGDATSAAASVLGGAATVLSASLSEALGDIEAGRIRILAIFAPDRLAGPLKGIPTAREQGVDVVLVNWRGLFMPPDVPPDAVRFWEKTIGKMVKSKPWNKTLDEMHWRPFFLTGEGLRKFLDEDLLLTQRVLQELGFLR